MANDAAASLARAILVMLQRQQFFAWLGGPQSRALVQEILQVARSYDAPEQEIVCGIGEHLQLCEDCFQVAEDLKEGICGACRASRIEPAPPALRRRGFKT